MFGPEDKNSNFSTRFYLKNYFGIHKTLIKSFYCCETGICWEWGTPSLLGRWFYWVMMGLPFDNGDWVR